MIFQVLVNCVWPCVDIRAAFPYYEKPFKPQLTPKTPLFGVIIIKHLYGLWSSKNTMSAAFLTLLKHRFWYVWKLSWWSKLQVGFLTPVWNIVLKLKSMIPWAWNALSTGSSLEPVLSKCISVVSKCWPRTSRSTFWYNRIWVMLYWLKQSVTEAGCTVAQVCPQSQLGPFSLLPAYM